MDKFPDSRDDCIMDLYFRSWDCGTDLNDSVLKGRALQIGQEEKLWHYKSAKNYSEFKSVNCVANCYLTQLKSDFVLLR